MSKLSRAAATSQTLSIVAMEEASRLGLREADFEHLLLALVVNDQTAGVALRAAGITLADARSAVESLHEEQLASLGIHAGLPAPGRIVFHETGGYEWSRRASDLIGRAAGRGRAGDAAAVLRELLAEPSGLVGDLIDRLGTTPRTVLAELDHAEEAPRARATRQHAPGTASGSSDTFVPAPVAVVWALVSDPARIPEWHPILASVDVADENAGPATTSPAAETVPDPGLAGATVQPAADGDPARPAQTPLSTQTSQATWSPQSPPNAQATWTARSTTTSSDGKAVRVRPEHARCQVELVDVVPQARVTWRFTYPDAAAQRPVSVEITLAPTGGGTQVSVVQSWTRSTGWRSVVGLPLRPLSRALLWLAASQTGNAISRVLRQPQE